MNDNEKLYIVEAIFSSISAIGSMFIITVYAKFQSLHCYSFKLIVILSIFDCIENLVLLIPTHLISSEPNSICIFQAASIQFSALGSCLWTGCMCLLLYLQVIRKASNFDLYFKLCLGCTLSLCVITTVVPILTNSYAYVGGNCWITGNTELGKIFRFTLLFGIVWIVIIFNSITYVQIIQKVKSEMSIKNKLIEEGRLLVQRLRLYPIAMIATYAPLTIVRALQSFSDRPVPNWLYMVAYGFYMANGFCNSIIYGFNNSVRQALKESVELRDGIILSSRQTLESSFSI